MHWIWLWATFKKNNQTTINAPTNTPFVQKYANYNSTGNRTTTSSHLNSGLRIWTEKNEMSTRVIDKTTCRIYSQEICKQICWFLLRKPLHFTLISECDQRWGRSYTRSAFAITRILTFISYDATRFYLDNIMFNFLLIFQTRILFATQIFSWRVMENIRGDQKLQEWKVLWATILFFSILFISPLNGIANIGFMIRNNDY